MDASHRKTEHGWHMVLGFYARMRGLMRRAGIDERIALDSMGGQQHPYEPWSGRVHDLDSSGGALAFAGRSPATTGSRLATASISPLHGRDVCAREERPRPDEARRRVFRHVGGRARAPSSHDALQPLSLLPRGILQLP